MTYLKNRRSTAFGGLFALLALPANAQGPTAPPMMPPAAPAMPRASLMTAMIEATGGDPATPNPMGLLSRSEVQTAIHLDLKQKALLRDLQGISPAQAEEQMRQLMMQTRNLPPPVRRARLDAAQAALQAQTAPPQGELTPKVQEILRPDQVARLRELDLQYRGPLALGSPAVAEKARLFPEHRTAIAQVAADFAATRNGLCQQFLQDVRQSGDARSGQPAPDLTRAFAPTRRKVMQARKDAEARALAALDQDEAQRWADLQGEQFVFRTDVNTPIVPR